MASSAAELLKNARQAAGLNQRELAAAARTAQSVVARIEVGDTSPSWDTLARLVGAVGYQIDARLDPVGPLGRAALDEATRLGLLTAEDRLRELRNVDRFFASIRRVG